jgi:beta-glucosidase/6-phospho-beta-glucosidase/beta-galactosidase
MRRALLIALAACGSKTLPPAIDFGAMGPLVGDAGKHSFRFGAASAATQIEDMNTNTDWFVWTAPPGQGGMGKDHFIADAVQGYSRDMADIQLVAQMHLDSYRFSIEWARVEPVKGQIDDAAIQHYRDELVALRAMGIRPVVTIHHFSNPIWVGDPRAIGCTGGPTSTNLCGLGSAGGPQIIAAMAAHAGLLAQRLGDLVDEWGTVNEPMNYLFAGYGAGIFPPGKSSLGSLKADFVPVVRDYIAAHAAMYKAIKQNDTIDADGDGIAAAVGLSMSVADWEPSRGNRSSNSPDDVAARDRLVYFLDYLFVDALVQGGFDSQLTGSIDETHPEWLGTIDWLGLQYYFRAGVTASPALFSEPISLTPCTGGLDLGACLQTAETTWCVPQMGYEFWSDGIRPILIAYAQRYPGLPLVVSEGGIATDVGERRAQNIVRSLESIARARDENGVDVRGYYHWSLTDNFEWAQGFAPHFGLYSVDAATFARTATTGASVFGDIAAARAVSPDQRATYGGTGAMAVEPGYMRDPFCAQQLAP